MSINISKKLSRNKKKISYFFEWDKAAGQRVSSGIFTYSTPKNNVEKNHNKEAILILESKRSKMILERKAAKKIGYFISNPTENLASKSNPNKKKKQIIEPPEYIKLLKTPCSNFEVRRAFIISLYAALRWCDVEPLDWENIRSESIILTQCKTKVEVEIPLHPIAKLILGPKDKGLFLSYQLPMVQSSRNSKAYHLAFCKVKFFSVIAGSRRKCGNRCWYVGAYHN